LASFYLKLLYYTNITIMPLTRHMMVSLTAASSRRQVFLALMTSQLLLMTSLCSAKPQDFFENDDSSTSVAAAADEDVALANATSSFVADIPEFVSTNRSLTATLGDSLTLSCQVNKLSGYQIIWYKRRTPTEEWKVLRIGQTPVVIKKNDTRFSFESNSTILRIVEIELEDQGLYKCEVAVANTPKLYLDVQVISLTSSAASSGSSGVTNAAAAAAAATTTTAVISTMLMSISVCLLMHVFAL